MLNRGSLGSVAKALLRRGGYVVHRTPRSIQEFREIPLFEDPLDALLHQRGDKPAAFHCPVEKWVHFEGFGLADGSWHPFRETLRAYVADGHTSYDGSVLEAYHNVWQPRSAAEALPGFKLAPAVFTTLPASCLFHMPWVTHAPPQTIRNVNIWNRRDWKELGADYLSPDVDGIKDFGPISSRNGAFEMKRLIWVYESLREEGFVRKHGDIPVTLIKRGDDYRFLPRGGYHRAVAMSALGHDTMPARHRDPWIIDVDDAKHWPQVRAGVWAEKEARAYVDHLFDFDSCQWSKNIGLA